MEATEQRPNVTPLRPNATERVDLAEAGRRLGLTPDAVRARIRRGSLVGGHDGRRLWVEVPALPDESAAEATERGSVVTEQDDRTRPNAEAPPTERDRTPDVAALEELATLRATVTELRARVDEQGETVADLRRRLDHTDREKDELRQLLAAAVATARQLPEQTAASAPRTDSETGTDEQSVIREGKSNVAPSHGLWGDFLRRLGLRSSG